MRLKLLMNQSLQKGELVMDFYEKMRIVCLEIPYGSVKNIASK